MNVTRDPGEPKPVSSKADIYIVYKICVNIKWNRNSILSIRRSLLVKWHETIVESAKYYRSINFYKFS